MTNVKETVVTLSCGKLFVEFSDGKAIIKEAYCPTSNIFTIPKVINDCPVTTIGNYAFESLDTLTNIIIPDGVTSIGDCAFSGCYELIGVDIPDSVISIGERAFDECGSSAIIEMSDSVISIGDNAFGNCKVLKLANSEKVLEDNDEYKISTNKNVISRAELTKVKNNMSIYVAEGYTIKACKPKIGKVYYNPLENVNYVATEEDSDKILLIGTVGEPWFASITKVCKDYTKEDGSDLTIKDFSMEKINIVRKISLNAAIELTEDTDVEIKAGNILHAKKGDYLVCSVKDENGKKVPDDEWGYWTINRKVFHNTNQKIYGEGYYGLETTRFYEETQQNFDKEISKIRFSIVTSEDFYPWIIKHKENCPFTDILGCCGISKERFYEDNHIRTWGDCKTLEELFCTYPYRVKKYDLFNFTDISVPEHKYYVREWDEKGKIIYSTNSKEEAEEFMKNYFFLETNE